MKIFTRFLVYVVVVLFVLKIGHNQYKMWEQITADSSNETHKLESRFIMESVVKKSDLTPEEDKVVFNITFILQSNFSFYITEAGVEQDSGVVFRVYDEAGRTVIDPEGIIAFIDTEAEQTPKGFFVPKNQPKVFNLAVEMGKFNGMRGVVIEAYNIKLPNGDVKFNQPYREDADSGLVAW